jgi:hypothetical protein
VGCQIEKEKRMTKAVYCSEMVDYEDILDEDTGFFVDNKRFEYTIFVEDDMLTLRDCLGRYVPVDITQIDQVLDALITARSMLLVPLAPDTYVESDLGC